MHIQDFHSKLTSVHEGGNLFEALRSLSRIDDPSVFDSGENLADDWPVWPALDAHAPHAASVGV